MVFACWKPSTQVFSPPLHESVPSQAPPLEVPTQAVVAGWRAAAGRAGDEPEQLSATSHCPADARQMVVAGWKPSTKVFSPPLHESGPSQGPPFEVPTQAVVAGWKASAGQSPDEPEQLSATSHCPADARQMVVAGWKPSTQVFSPPLHESVPSQGPPFEVPTQAVVAGWKASAGQAPDEPVQLSATSHCPADARQMVVAGWKPSTQVFSPPLHESVPSQAPPFEVPVQGVVAGWKASAGQAPDEPVQLSATSHCPADARQMVVDGLGFDEHSPFARQMSGLSHTPVGFGSPHAAPGVGMCTTWIFWQVPPLQSRLDKHVTVESFEQVPWHLSMVQGLSSGKAIQAPGNRPQLHFDGDPA